MFLDAEVTVAAEGAVTSIELRRQDLPAVLSDAVKGSIGRLLFEPIRIDGVPAEVTTPMRFSACFAVEGEQLNLALDLLGHGPQNAEGPVAPPFPREYVGPPPRHFELLLSFRVDAEGRTHFEQLQQPKRSKRDQARIETQLRQWIEAQTFIPERVNGQPVAARMEWPLSFSVDSGRRRPDDPTADATCARAREGADDDRPRIVDGGSPLRLRSQG